MGDASKISKYDDLDDESFSGTSESEEEISSGQSLILYGINVGAPYMVVDNTNAIESTKIILDRMARILEGSEICSAVTILPDESPYEFFLTTNTLSESSKGDSKGVVLIGEVMSFFNELSKNGDDFLMEQQDVLNQIFLKICIRKMEGETKEGIHIADGADGEVVVKSIVENILRNPQIMKTPTDELSRKYNSTGSRRKPKDVLAAYCKFRRIRTPIPVLFER